MVVRNPNLCVSCVHLDRASYNSGDDTPVCEAFPNGIPDDILVQGADHRTPRRGDGGVTYEQDPLRAGAYKIWKRFHDKKQKEDQEKDTELATLVERVEQGEDPQAAAREMIGERCES